MSITWLCPLTDLWIKCKNIFSLNKHTSSFVLPEEDNQPPQYGRTHTAALTPPCTQIITTLHVASPSCQACIKMTTALTLCHVYISHHKSIIASYAFKHALQACVCLFPHQQQSGTSHSVIQLKMDSDCWHKSHLYSSIKLCGLPCYIHTRFVHT